MSRVLLTLAFGVLAGAANAACPPEDSDGTVIRKDDLLLAYRPLLKAGPGPRAKPIPMARHFALEVQLCDKDEISSAQLSKADAGMPAHKHGMNYRPTITPLGKGRFRVQRHDVPHGRPVGNRFRGTGRQGSHAPYP